MKIILQLILTFHIDVNSNLLMHLNLLTFPKSILPFNFGTIPQSLKQEIFLSKNYDKI
jgi:hypothetical protein